MGDSPLKKRRRFPQDLDEQVDTQFKQHGADTRYAAFAVHEAEKLRTTYVVK